MDPRVAEQLQAQGQAPQHVQQHVQQQMQQHAHQHAQQQALQHAQQQAPHQPTTGLQHIQNQPSPGLQAIHNASPHPTYADFGSAGSHGHDFTLSDGLTDLHHAGSLQDDPNSADKMGASRQSIIAEVESTLAAQYAQMPQDELHQWHANLQQSLSETSDMHHKAKDYLKQVDAARALARDAYRADQASIEKQKTWKTRVGELKEAQDSLRITKEAFYRASAAVEVVTRELKMRTANLNVARPAEVNPRGVKRKRTAAPEETCPYCHHIYTVRDGLSTKVDIDGNRLHLRKCQCREKTPPCRNCPVCKDNSDIMALNDPNLQFQLCQVRFKCDICACRCPGAGKWVEGDTDSRASYAQRTQARHGQLNAMGWFGSIGTASPTAAQDMHNPEDAGAKRKYRELKRLPADIRAQVALLKGHPGSQGPMDPSGVRSSPMPDLLGPGGLPLGLGMPHAGALAGMTPAMVARALDKPAPALPADVARLVKEVFDTAAGLDAVNAVSDYLRSQRVTSLADLQWLQLDWLCAALEPQGLPPLLLNKFLSLAKQRI